MVIASPGRGAAGVEDLQSKGQKIFSPYKAFPAIQPGCPEFCSMQAGSIRDREN